MTEASASQSSTTTRLNSGRRDSTDSATLTSHDCLRTVAYRWWGGRRKDDRRVGGFVGVAGEGNGALSDRGRLHGPDPSGPRGRSAPRGHHRTEHRGGL